MKTRLRRFAPWLIGLVALAIVGAAVVYGYRWRIGKRAVEIADPSVRAWAAREVARLSQGSYQLSASTIKVDAARRRVAIDTITVITDSAVNARRKVPLPLIALRFHNCALEGIDLDRLAAGQGLHVTRVGCDTVAVMADVPAEVSAQPRDAKAAQGSFLTLRQKLNLPRNLPSISMDTIAFPQVRLVLSIEGNEGRRTNITFDRLSTQFDSLRYERNGSDDGDRVLLSRDVRVSLEHFEGSREAANRVSLKLLAANLARGTLRLDSLIYAPLPGGFADSLGVKEMQIRHLALDGVDWRRFLTSGDINVGRLTLDSALVRIPYRGGGPQTRAEKLAESFELPAPPLEMTLRTLQRHIQLDTLLATSLTFISEGRAARDSSAITVARLDLAGLAFDDRDSSWNGPFPVGRASLFAAGIRRTGSGEQLAVDSLRVDVPQGRVTVSHLQAGPQGTDEDFLRRIRYRQDRVSIVTGEVHLIGVDLPGYLRRGVIASRQVSADGFLLDVLSDKRKPSQPGRGKVRRFPQQKMASLGVAFRIDTLIIKGRLRYRERDSTATTPGVLTFDRLTAQITGLHSAEASSDADSLPLHLVADAHLMGVGVTHVEATMPLAATSFQMRFRGSIGAMPADSLNGFLVNAIGMQFKGGQIEGIRFDAVVDHGHAKGTLIPRWHDLGVALPGIAKRSGGLFAGIRRAVAGFAANAFIIRSDNAPPGTTVDGVIDHQWTPEETLPKFIWVSLREAILPVLKK